jgi:hypothetical protein
MMRTKHSDAGFTVAEYVIAIAIMFMVAMSVMGGLAYASGANLGDMRRTDALDLANQRLEQARNLPYDSVGTVNGYPTGTIPNTEVVNEFTVKTEIGWSESTIATGTNMRSTSKYIKVSVSWTNPKAGEVHIASNIAGKSATTGGDVKIFVVDGDTPSKKISGATLTIKPATGVSATQITGSDGGAFWGKVPAGSITVTGSAPGYALDFSALSGAKVITGMYNEWTVTAVKPSVGRVFVKDQFNNPVPGATVKIVGPSPSTTAYTLTSDTSGYAVFDNLLKGTYSVNVTGPTGYTNGTGSLGIIVGGSTYDTTVSITKNARLFVKVVDEQGVVVSGATVAVNGAGTVTPASATSDANGQTVHALSAGGSYTVSVSKTGYMDGSGAATVASGADGSVTVTVTTIQDTFFKIRVIDQNNAVVQGATVAVPGFANVTTGVDGYAQFLVEPLTPYTATVSKTGYIGASGSVTSIANGGTQTIDIMITYNAFGTVRIKYGSSASSTSKKTVRIFRSSSSNYTTAVFWKDVTFSAKDVEQAFTNADANYYYWASYLGRTASAPPSTATPGLLSYTAGKTTSTAAKILVGSGTIYLYPSSTN